MHAAKGVGGEPGGPGEAQLPGTTCGAAAAHHALRGALGGLIVGLVWGIVQEKKFILRNVHLADHLKDPPIRLFSVLRRSVTTAPVAATFLGIYGGLSCAYSHRRDSWSPHLCSGAAGTAAGAVRTALSEAALHPLVHAQRSASAGLLAVAICSAGQYLEYLEAAEGEVRRREGGAHREPWPDDTPLDLDTST